MGASIQIVPFDGIWGSFSKLLDQGKISLPDHPRSALDLGCGAGYPLYILYHDHGFTSLTGVDQLTEAGVLAQEKRHLPADRRTASQEILWNCNSIYELYRLVIQPERSKVHRSSLQPIEFYQHLNFEWGRDIEEYLTAESVSQFDLIILSNVLHFWPLKAAKALVKKAMSRLKAGGVLLVRVYHEGSEKFKGSGFAGGKSSLNPSEHKRKQMEFRKGDESYWTYNKDLFLSLFDEMEVVSFEGVRNTQVPGYKFLTAVASKRS